MSRLCLVCFALSQFIPNSFGDDRVNDGNTAIFRGNRATSSFSSANGQPQSLRRFGLAAPPSLPGLRSLPPAQIRHGDVRAANRQPTWDQSKTIPTWVVDQFGRRSLVYLPAPNTMNQSMATNQGQQNQDQQRRDQSTDRNSSTKKSPEQIAYEQATRRGQRFFHELFSYNRSTFNQTQHNYSRYNIQLGNQSQFGYLPPNYSRFNQSYRPSFHNQTLYNQRLPRISIYQQLSPARFSSAPQHLMRYPGQIR